MAKFIPKTQKHSKLREKKEIPSFVELSDEISKLRIREFMNPTTYTETSRLGSPKKFDSRN